MTSPALSKWTPPIRGNPQLGKRYGEAGPMWSSGYHTGQDYQAPRGTPVVAVADGTVTFRGVRGWAGNLVIVKHNDGTESWYAHLNTFSLIFPGSKVLRGTQLGTVGSTGNTTGPHLHLEAHRGGKHFDPMKMMTTGVAPPDTVDPDVVTPGGGDFGILTDTSTWARVGQFVGGGALLVVGLILVKKTGVKGLIK